MNIIFKRKKNVSDEYLLEQYKSSGNIDYLSKVFLRYTDLVFGVCLKYLKSKEDAQDASMQIFEKLVDSVKTNSIDNFKPWLYVVCKNYCLMEIRKNKAQQKDISFSEKNIDSFMEFDFELHPLDNDNDNTKEDALKKCMEKLKIEQKTTVELFYFKKLTYDQISTSMDIEVKKVKSYLQNAKRNLKICIEKNHVE